MSAQPILDNGFMADAGLWDCHHCGNTMQPGAFECGHCTTTRAESYRVYCDKIAAGTCICPTFGKDQGRSFFCPQHGNAALKQLVAERDFHRDNGDEVDPQ